MGSTKIIISAVLLAMAGTVRAADGQATVTTGVDYSSGKYGGTQATDMTYIPVIGKYESGPYVFKLTVPYIRITAPSGGTVVSVDPSGRLVRRSVGARTANSGLGDIVTGLSYNLLNDAPTQTAMDITGKIKFGTADENKGLGTGEADYSLQADLYKTYNKATALASLGYRVLGSPAGFNLNNVWYGSVGGAYKFSQETSGGVILDLRQPSTPTGAQVRELMVYMTQKMGGNYKLQGYLVNGFTDASPDWGVGAMVGISLK